jgi:hypothetical protein
VESRRRTIFNEYLGELFAQFRTRVATRSAIENAG